MTDPDHEQLSMQVGQASGPAHFAIITRFQRACDDVGPYVWERWASNRRRTFVAMKCNRPAGHGDHYHGWSDGREGVAFTWTRDGQAIHPLPIGDNTHA